MTSVLLVYPFFQSFRDNSEFRFPPLGVAYVAAGLRAAGHEVSILDCTFLSRERALENARASRADIVGVYGMITMKEDCLRGAPALLVAGGPLPSSDPAAFLEHFDAVVIGEGERTMVELADAREHGLDFRGVPGIAAGTVDAPRDLLPNDAYIRHGRRKYGYAITTVMSTRGCPFTCEFCSNVVFGASYRARSAANVVDEVEGALALGYDRIHFADDVFTLNRARVQGICAEIRRRGLRFRWECLGRVDSIDLETAGRMKEAGCDRIFFGIESGDYGVLALMNKKITAEKARRAVEAAHAARLRTGAFFILYYPGETDDTVLATLRFALSLPLDYLSFTMPYPIPAPPCTAG